MNSKNNYSFWVRNLSLCFLFIFFFCLPAVAQTIDPNALGETFIIRPWAVGQTMTLKTNTLVKGSLVETKTITYSIVGKEKIKGVDYFWLEMDMVNPDGSSFVRKIQVRNPSGLDFENTLSSNKAVLSPRRKILQFVKPGESHPFPPVEIPVPASKVSQIENGPSPSEIKNYTHRYLSKPNQNVSVSAGNFTSLEVQHFASKPFTEANGVTFSPYVQAWGAPEIPIWGLIKEERQGWDSQKKVVVLRQIELISYNETGAVSKLVGKIFVKKALGPTPTPGIKILQIGKPSKQLNLNGHE